MPPRIDRLESLTADNSAQQREISELRRRIAAKMTELAQVIDLRRQSSEAARQEVLSDRGLLAMTAVRDQVDTMKKEELRLLVVRQQDTAQSYRVALATVTVTTAVGLMLVAGCIWLLWRNLQVRMEAAARVRQEREWLRTTLASIGDAVIATDGQGQVAFLNGVAQALTGCSETDALWRPLDEVLVIHNEQTRARIEHPVAPRAVRRLGVVGLANHTVLVSKQGMPNIRSKMRGGSDQGFAGIDHRGCAGVQRRLGATPRRRRDAIHVCRQRRALDVVRHKQHISARGGAGCAFLGRLVRGRFG